MVEKAWPDWVPIKLRDWLKSLENGGQRWPDHQVRFMERVSIDPRMRAFWDWLPTASAAARLPILLTPTALIDAVRMAMIMPGKPGNLTPGERSAYFEKVRKHADALILLLQETRFDRTSMQELSDDELDKPLSKRVYPWGVDESEEGHIVAFSVRPDGVYEMPYDYPDSYLVNTLFGLREWTEWDDQWDGNPLRSSDPISHANSKNAATIYFTRVMFRKFKGQGVDIPFALLATLANVALKLPADAQMDEDTARKQVRRYEERKGAVQVRHPPEF